MNFLQQLLSTYNKGLKYDALEERLRESIKRNNKIAFDVADIQEVLDKERKQFTAAITNLEEEIEILHDDLEHCCEDGETPFILHDVMDNLKDNIQSTPFKYPFKGDGRDYDIKYSLIVKDKSLVDKYADLIDEKYNPQTPTECVDAVSKYFVYVKKPRYKAEKIDVWAPADEFLKTWTDDCDSTGIAMHVLIRELLFLNDFEEHYDRLYLHINDNYLEGHANNIWLYDDGMFYTVESTIDAKGCYERKWLNCPLAHDSFYKRTRGFANLNGSHKGSNALRKCFL